MTFFASLQTICDCARQYAERIETILEKNRYYDAEQENQFDVKDQVGALYFCPSQKPFIHL